ncbi:MAG TPA: hypothetical protein VMV45_21490 [Casimicrobiaceae bacterium]|nr:hypothetical protein [Casimicrobiaceae bacterium]
MLIDTLGTSQTFTCTTLDVRLKPDDVAVADNGWIPAGVAVQLLVYGERLLPLAPSDSGPSKNDTDWMVPWLTVAVADNVTVVPSAIGDGAVSVICGVRAFAYPASTNSMMSSSSCVCTWADAHMAHVMTAAAAQARLS